MYERPYIKEIQARIEEPRKFIQVILGPRQVGKTTMVNQLLQKLSLPYVYESADAVSATNSAWLTQVWETARLRMKAANVPEYLLVVDEISKRFISVIGLLLKCRPRSSGRLSNMFISGDIRVLPRLLMTKNVGKTI